MNNDEIPVLKKLINKGKPDNQQDTDQDLQQQIQTIIDTHTSQMKTEIKELLAQYIN